MNVTEIYHNFLEPVLGWLALISLATFILSLVLIPFIVGRLPEDCFKKLYYTKKTTTPSSFGALILLIMRNVLGLLLVLAGVAMLFLPGQGLITILLGTLLLSFPGKRTLIKKLVVQPKIQRSLNWLRKKRDKAPFLWP